MEIKLWTEPHGIDQNRINIQERLKKGEGEWVKTMSEMAEEQGLIKSAL